MALLIISGKSFDVLTNDPFGSLRAGSPCGFGDIVWAKKKRVAVQCGRSGNGAPKPSRRACTQVTRTATYGPEIDQSQRAKSVSNITIVIMK